MPSIASLNLLDPNLGIQNIMDPGGAEHMPGARPLAANVLSEPGLEDLYSASTASRLLERALCPPVGDGDLLRPDDFFTNLSGALDALENSRDPAVRAFVRGDLRPLREDVELLKAYTGLMVSG